MVIFLKFLLICYVVYKKAKKNEESTLLQHPISALLVILDKRMMEYVCLPGPRDH